MILDNILENANENIIEVLIDQLDVQKIFKVFADAIKNGWMREAAYCICNLIFKCENPAQFVKIASQYVIKGLARCLKCIHTTQLNTKILNAVQILAE